MTNPSPRKSTASPGESESPESGRSFWPTFGIVAVAAATGGFAGIVAVKGLLAVKTATAAHLALAGKGAAEASALPAFAAKGQVALDTLAAGTPAASGAAPSILESAFRTLAKNAVPLFTGAAGGGAAGFGVARNRLAQAREQLHREFEQKTEVLKEEAAHLKTALEAVETRIGHPPPPSEPHPAKSGGVLEAIHGIGEVYAERLRAAGIHGFADLAAQTPERIREIIGPGAHLAGGQIAAWIREASELANRATV